MTAPRFAALLTACAALVAAAAARPASAQDRPSPPPSQSSAKALVLRWLDLQNATLSLRFRYVDNSADVTTTRQLQHRETLGGG